MSGNNCELRAEGESVAVQTEGACGVGKMREERRPLRTEGAVEGDQAGRTPWRALMTRLPAMRRRLPLQRREEREVREGRQRGEASQSVHPSGGEASTGQCGSGGGGGEGHPLTEGEAKSVESSVRTGESSERKKRRR